MVCCYYWHCEVVAFVMSSRWGLLPLGVFLIAMHASHVFGKITTLEEQKKISYDTTITT